MKRITGYSAKSLIHQHEKAIEILDAIKYFEMKKFVWIDHYEGFAGTITPESRQKYIRKIQVLDMCINRMNERYKKLMAENI